MAKQNKMMLPILLGGGLLAVLMMGGKKAKAAAAPAPGTGELPEGGGIQVEPLPGPVPEPGPKPEPTPKLPNVGPVTAYELGKIEWAINGFADEVNTSFIPEPWNKRQPGQSKLDWKSNLAFWLAYSSKSGDWVKSGHAAVPYKLTEDMTTKAEYPAIPKSIQNDPKYSEYQKWAAVWLRIRNYIKKNYTESQM